MRYSKKAGQRPNYRTPVHFRNKSSHNIQIRRRAVKKERPKKFI